MAVIVKVRIPQRTGELIKVTSQFQGEGQLPKLLGQEADDDPGHQVVTLEFKSDTKTVRTLAEKLGYPVLDITEVSEHSGQTSGTGDTPLDLVDLRARYISAIGPIGGALFDEAVDALGDACGTPEGNRQLVKELARQIDEDDEAIRFRQYAGLGI